jgi:hypothetical protein
MHTRFLLLTGALALAAACSNAGDTMTLPVLSTGQVVVQVYFDGDGSQSYTVGDSLFQGAHVSLLPAGGTDTVRVVTTDARGLAIFDSVPLGSWRVVVDRHALNDSVGVVAGDTGILRVLARGDSNIAARQVRFGYREVTIAQARALAAGHRVMIRGIVVSALQYFHDSSAFVSDPTGRIRITSARHRAGRTGNNVGDSVLVLGTSGVDHGQPVLLAGLFTSLGATLVPLPVTTTVVGAHNALNGTLDAALVLISGAFIADTLTTGPDFLLRIANPADSTTTTDVLVDSLLGIPRTVWKPGFGITVRGVLVPKGDGTWILKPRGGADITLSPHA